MHSVHRQVIYSPGDRETLRDAHLTLTERSKPDGLLYKAAKLTVREANTQRVKDCGKSQCHPVMGWIGVETLPHAKAGRLPHGLLLQHSL
jgi:hypothetical protein